MRNKKFGMIVLIVLLVAQTVGFAAAEPAASNLIVRFEEDVSLSQVEGLLHGMGVQARVLEIINGVAFRGSPKAVAALSRKFGVISVRVDKPVHALPKPSSPPGLDKKDPPEEDPVSSQELDWGVAEIQADEVWAQYTGLGVKVAVLDTGIDIDHPDLQVIGGANFDPSVSTYDDNNGHGTHVAGTIAALDNEFGVVGVAPEASLFGVKVLDRKGSGWISQVIAGIDWAVQNEMDVINMSLGSDSPDPDLEDALDLAVSAGIIVVAAAGNDTYDIDYPGAYTSTIAVGAINPDRTLAYFSSQGEMLDVVAPGVAIISTYKNGRYKDLNGTSMATPHVAGLAALYIEKYNGANLTSFRNALQSSSTDLGISGPDNMYGCGLVNAVELLNP